MKLTDRTIAALKPHPTRRVDHYDDLVPGLALRVNRSNKSWILRYRERIQDQSGSFAAGKRERRWTFGVYPTLTLAAARKKAQKALSDLTTRGIDPALGKAQARNAESFSELAADYIEHHAKPHKRSWREDERQLRADVLPHWASRPAKAISRTAAYALLDRKRDTPAAFNRLKALCSRLYKHGIDRGWVEDNPFAAIPKLKETSRTRVISDEELRELVSVLRAAETSAQPPVKYLSPTMALGLELQLRTGQRGGEVFTAAWPDVDMETGWWTIPGEKTKNGQEHRVPLSAAALRLIAKARSTGSGPWVFAGPQGGSLKVKAEKVIPNLRNAGVVTGDYWRHDIRRTVITGLQALGLANTVIYQVINQQEGGPRAFGAYARHGFDQEKRTALETWGRHLDGLLTGKTSRVVPFAERRR